MKIKLLFILLLLIIGLSDAQRRRSKGRNKSRTKNCHLKEAEKCLDSMANQFKNNSTELLINEEGVNKFCSTVKKSFIDCITGYFKKCGTPLHREVGMLFTDQIRSQLNQFCIDKKSEFLKSSKCLHENVFRTKQYKNDCNSIYLLSLKQAQTNDAQATDLICCGYRFWIKCTQQLAQSKCQAPGASSFMILTKYGFLGFPDLTCPTALFNSNSKKCKSVIPSKSSEGQKQIKINFGESGLSKYNVANMFSFIFH